LEEVKALKALKALEEVKALKAGKSYLSTSPLIRLYAYRFPHYRFTASPLIRFPAFTA
jgi:hypothetical protein